MNEKLSEWERKRLAKAIEEAKGIENTIFIAIVFLAQGYINRFDCDLRMIGKFYKVKAYRIDEHLRIDFIRVNNENERK